MKFDFSLMLKKRIKVLGIIAKKFLKTYKNIIKICIFDC